MRGPTLAAITLISSFHTYIHSWCRLLRERGDLSRGCVQNENPLSVHLDFCGTLRADSREVTLQLNLFKTDV